MKLYLVRHGEVIPTSPDQTLSDKGKEDAHLVAHLLKQNSVEAEIIHSEKKRAAQTAEIFAQAISPDQSPKEREGLKPMDTVDSIYEEIQQRTSSLMIVGHLPHLVILSSQLLMKYPDEIPIHFDNSAVACFSGQGSDWVLEWFLSPSLLKEANLKVALSSV